ncbi:MAG: hypothetical protein GC136_03330 [Alphaproteobacteria bacterium]|nr:hypothetical protein [Alphaproteobacteria bacterium]
MAKRKSISSREEQQKQNKSRALWNEFTAAVSARFNVRDHNVSPQSIFFAVSPANDTLLIDTEKSRKNQISARHAVPLRFLDERRPLSWIWEQLRGNDVAKNYHYAAKDFLDDVRSDTGRASAFLEQEIQRLVKAVDEHGEGWFDRRHMTRDTVGLNFSITRQEYEHRRDFDRGCEYLAEYDRAVTHLAQTILSCVSGYKSNWQAQTADIPNFDVYAKWEERQEGFEKAVTGLNDLSEALQRLRTETGDISQALDEKGGKLRYKNKGPKEQRFSAANGDFELGFCIERLEEFMGTRRADDNGRFEMFTPEGRRKQRPIQQILNSVLRTIENEKGFMEMPEPYKGTILDALDKMTEAHTQMQNAFLRDMPEFASVYVLSLENYQANASLLRMRGSEEQMNAYKAHIEDGLTRLGVSLVSGRITNPKNGMRDSLRFTPQEKQKTVFARTAPDIAA